MSEDVIKVFISYSWDSKEHKDKVYHLAQALRDDGIDCTIDQFVQSPDNWDRWMLDQIDESDFVLIVCTERYKRRYRGKEEVNKGLGVTWESTVIMGKLYDSQGRNPKFYPIFFDAPNLAIIPDGIRTSYFDLSGYDLFNLDNNEKRLKEDGGYQDLYRLLTNQPSVIPRKIGSLKKLETVDRETEQQEAEAAEQNRQQELEQQRGLEQQRREATQRQQAAQTQLASEKGTEKPSISKRFDVALSFPGEHRGFVQAVAEALIHHLQQEQVFYDQWYEAELARPNLDVYLQSIYRDEAELIVVFEVNPWIRTVD